LARVCLVSCEITMTVVGMLGQSEGVRHTAIFARFVIAESGKVLLPNRQVSRLPVLIQETIPLMSGSRLAEESCFCMSPKRCRITGRFLEGGPATPSTSSPNTASRRLPMQSDLDPNIVTKSFKLLATKWKSCSSLVCLFLFL